MKKLFKYIFLLLVVWPCKAQDNALEQYINQGLASNIALQQKEASYQQSIWALKEARSMFFPDIDLNARFTVADGGREIIFPLDTLLNGVYNTLNQILLAQGRPASFPEVEDETIPFLRPVEHETKVSLFQPIIHTDIYYYNKIQKDLMYAAEADLEAYKQTLVMEIKTAYFNHLQAVELKRLLVDTKILLLENVRVNKSLFNNQKVTADKVYRSEAELAKLESEAANAEKFVQTTEAYLNFLVNKPLDTNIEIDQQFQSEHLQLQLDSLQALSGENRAEIKMLDYYTMASENKVKMNKASRLPVLVGAVDYGFQGERYEFDADHDYILASIVLKWDLFHGFEKKRKIEKAKVELLQTQLVVDQTKEKIKLQTISAWYDLEAAVVFLEATEKEKKAARAAYKVVEKKYEMGQESLIAYIDARNTMTSAQQRNIMAQYDYYIKYAALEQAAGIYSSELLK